MDRTPTPQELEQLESLRQSIFRLPEFDSWLQHIREQRRAASAQVTANEANATMAEYVEFIEREYLASRPVAVVSTSNMVCAVCAGRGYTEEYSSGKRHPCHGCGPQFHPMNGAPLHTAICPNCQGTGRIAITNDTAQR